MYVVGGLQCSMAQCQREPKWNRACIYHHHCGAEQFFATQRHPNDCRAADYGYSKRLDVHCYGQRDAAEFFGIRRHGGGEHHDQFE